MSNRRQDNGKAPPRSPHKSRVQRTPPGNPATVGIGASAGGLDVCRKLVEAIPADIGMAFILVQHLDPTHQSMMVDLLAGHTSMVVTEAADGMPIERNHLYIIGPGTYLSVANGALHVSEPGVRHGARLPFDFLMNSMAKEYGRHAICVILSGTGADGSLGAGAVKREGGLVIAQDPDEATYDGMPRNAIKTGAVDLVLPVARIPSALVKYWRRIGAGEAMSGFAEKDLGPDRLGEVIELLRARTAHDFSLYKRGTLQRRMERRMGLAAMGIDDTERYVDMLRSDQKELDLLARDLLINVTSFFRDRQVFDFLADRIVPDLIDRRPPDKPLRIWIAGCSTGEEAYSLAMLIKEGMVAAKCGAKLQVFASDVDPNAVATAREGLYPETIAADVSPERLARFFSREDHNYRVTPELRAAVVFTVQDLLVDPPFARLDMVSCRNVLIYLGSEAQARVISLFHFALVQGGILLLGNSETAGAADGRFEIVSKPNSLYRHIGRSRPGDVAFSTGSALRTVAHPEKSPAPSRQAALADFCRRLVVEAYGPASVLIDQKRECLHFIGPTDPYLRVASGQPTYDLLAMAQPKMRTKLRSAIHRADKENARIVVPGGRVDHNGRTHCFSIEVQPVQNDGDTLFLISFVDEPEEERKQERLEKGEEAPRIAELKQELEATRTELEAAIRDLETFGDEQKALNEDALSINEEFQSTNEELLTSKEELQSLNEELTALNAQLQETLERQRTAANDLQNILYSTNVATLFLDRALGIRFFTPATKALFKVIATDIGRPLSDLRSLAGDKELLADAQTVLMNLAPIEREFEAHNGGWFLRRILPYRTHENVVAGVVITFTDTTDRKHSARAVEEAKYQAERANNAKSRFLAAASHDLRQPLQTLTLLQSLLARAHDDGKSKNLIARMGQTVAAMSGMLNTLLDINQIEADTVHAESILFPVGEVLDRLRGEFAYLAGAQKLDLRVVSCSVSVVSDPRLLEQMLRNLIANALKYTKYGKVLLGCRRRNGILSVEIWDTGVGIPDTELEAIFEEYHQLHNAARERSHGLGLGLSIVKRLGDLLGHRVRVRSHLGKGSVFAVEVVLQEGGRTIDAVQHTPSDNDVRVRAKSRTGTILVVEDDSEIRDLLQLLLAGEGHRVETASNGIMALELMKDRVTGPDLILADYNLPQGMDGIRVAAKIRERFGLKIPVLMLTGDISSDALRHIARQDCLRLNKPVEAEELVRIVQRLLENPMPSTPPSSSSKLAVTQQAPIVFVVDDDSLVREVIRDVLEASGRSVADYATAESFLEAYKPDREACLLIDAYLPGMSGIQLLQRLKQSGSRLPAIMITGQSDVPTAVRAMKAGALDFIEKPITSSELLAGVERALELARDSSKRVAWQADAAHKMSALSPRQREIMKLVLAGHPSKNIAADLCISQRTVENHRADIMKKMGVKSLPALARTALAADNNPEIQQL